MDITIAKFNTKDFELDIENYSGVIDKLIFSVEDCLGNTLIKKELGNGIKKIDDKTYVLSITSNDTKKMNKYYTYKYFIEVIIDDLLVDTTMTGNFKLLESSNELGDEING